MVKIPCGTLRFGRMKYGVMQTFRSSIRTANLILAKFARKTIIAGLILF